MRIISRCLGLFHRRRIRPLVRTRGPDSARLREIEEEAAADVAALRQDDEHFGKDAPANQDELLSDVPA